MADLSTLAILRRRLAGSNKMNPEIWDHVICALLAPAGSKVEQSPFNGAWCIYEPTMSGKDPFRLWEDRSGFKTRLARLVEVEAWTDAALELVERLLPGWEWSLDRRQLRLTFEPVTKYMAQVGEPGMPRWGAESYDRSIAIIRAAVEALIAQAKREVGNG